jgi:hypothetical protein
MDGTTGATATTDALDSPIHASKGVDTFERIVVFVGMNLDELLGSGYSCMEAIVVAVTTINVAMIRVRPSDGTVYRQRGALFSKGLVMIVLSVIEEIGGIPHF